MELRTVGCIEDDAMLEIKDVLGETVRLTKEVWDVIVIKHPELRNLKSYIAVTLSNPEVITRSFYDERVVLYYRYFPAILRGKFLVVVVKKVSNAERYVATAYITDKRKGGEILWLRK